MACVTPSSIYLSIIPHQSPRRPLLLPPPLIMHNLLHPLAMRHPFLRFKLLSQWTEWSRFRAVSLVDTHQFPLLALQRRWLDIKWK